MTPRLRPKQRVMLRLLPRRWVFLILLVAAYGSAFILIKLALTGVSPATLVFGRLSLGFLMLAPVAFFMRLRIPLHPRALKDMAAQAVLGFVLPFSLIAWGQEEVPSGMAGILMSLMPIMTIAFAHIFIPEEPLTRSKAAGFALAFVGTIVLIGPSALGGFGTTAADGNSVSKLLHELAVLAGAVCYAATAVVTRRAQPVHPIAGSVMILFIGALIIAPFALPGAIVEIKAASCPALGAVFLLAAFSTAGATIVYLLLIREAGASFFAVTNFLVPVWAAILGASLGMERLQPSAFAGLALVLVGVAMAQSKVRPA
jgi:drug/metabolite transporter (DMT)-like permease